MTYSIQAWATRAFLWPLLLSLVLASVSCSEDGSPVAIQDPESDSTWTYIVYDAADGSAVNIYDNYIVGPNMCSSRYVNLIGLHDDEESPAMYWRIDENNEVETLEAIGEVNTGDEETLYDIVTYAKANYPADRYIVAFYGHGEAFFGCCWDDTPELDGLRLHEIRRALTKAGGVDMVLFTAPCIMGCVELAYELRSCTDIVMASEALSTFLFWQYSLDDAFSSMHTNPWMTTHEVAELIIDRIPEYMPTYVEFEADSFLTMAAVRTGKVEPLAAALNDLATVYLRNPDAFETLVDSHYDEFATLPRVPEIDAFLVDIGNLARQLLRFETDPSIRSILRRTEDRLEEAVIAECHHESHGDVSGLSVFFPKSDFASLSLYQGGGDFTLEFATDTRWDELMSVLIEPSPAASSGARTESWRSQHQLGSVSLPGAPPPSF